MLLGVCAVFNDYCTCGYQRHQIPVAHLFCLLSFLWASLSTSQKQSVSCSFFSYNNLVCSPAGVVVRVRESIVKFSDYISVI